MHHHSHRRRSSGLRTRLARLRPGPENAAGIHKYRCGAGVVDVRACVSADGVGDVGADIDGAQGVFVQLGVCGVELFGVGAGGEGWCWGAGGEVRGVCW